MNPDERKMFFETLAKVLMWCFLLSFALLLFWTAFYFLLGDWAYAIHARWFELSRHDFDMLHYFGLGFIKALTFLFFLFPYISIRIVLRDIKAA
jgi:hypothetical protein